MLKSLKEYVQAEIGKQKSFLNYSLTVLPRKAFSNATSLSEYTSSFSPMLNCHPAVNINAIAPKATIPILNFFTNLSISYNVFVNNITAVIIKTKYHFSKYLSLIFFKNLFLIFKKAYTPHSGSFENFCKIQ